jgi:hypothetical protein
MPATEESIADKHSFLSAYIEPADSLAEMTFRLVMVLTWTMAARVIFREADPRTLILAVVGCNLAWALIDAIMFLIVGAYLGGQHSRFMRSVRQAPDARVAERVVADWFDEELEPVLVEAQRAQVYHWIVAGAATRSEPRRLRVTRDDIVVAAISGVLVVVCALPVVIAFLVIPDDWLALRISNVLMVGLLFVGYRWAHYTVWNPIVAGLVLLLIGLVLVSITVLLGGRPIP